MSRFVYILCIALLTASCVKVDSSENGSGNAITFGTQRGGGTRAATLIGGSDTDAFREAMAAFVEHVVGAGSPTG